MSFVAKLRELVGMRMHGDVADAHVAETVKKTVLAQVEAEVTIGAQDALEHLPEAIERGLEAALGRAFSAQEPEAPAKPRKQAKAKAPRNRLVESNGALAGK